MRSLLWRGCLIALVALSSLIVLVCGGLWLPLQAIYHLAIGWVLYLIEVLPEVQLNPSAIASAAAGLMVLAVGIHCVLYRLRKSRTIRTSHTKSARAWATRWTVNLLALFLFLFIAGTSAVGVAHQIRWMATSPELIVGGGFRDSVAQMRASNSLLAIGQAMLAHEEQNGTLPLSHSVDREGRPLLSWRVHLLPYLDQTELYQAFHLDEPWDSPHNLKLLPRMPEVYEMSPVEPTVPPHLTRFQVLVGPGAAFEDQRCLRTADDFLDDPEETFLVVIAASPVLWTKPEDLAYQPEGSVPVLYHFVHRGCVAAMAHGSVRSYSRSATESTLRACISRSAGDRPGSDW